MKLRTLFLLPIMAFIFPCCNGQDVSKINADDFQREISQIGVQIVDCRTPEEYSAKHIAHSKNINFTDLATFKSSLDKLDKTKPVYLYALSGDGSASAADYAVKAGFKQVYYLEGGITAWIDKGKPVVTANNMPVGGGMTFDDYLLRIKNTDKLVLVDFSAVWCGPCKMLKPAVEKVVDENSSKVELLPIDIDKYTSVANAMHVTAIPLLVLYKNGKEVWRNLGLTDEETITDAIRKFSK